MIDLKNMTDDQLCELLENLPVNEELTAEDKVVLAEAERRDIDFRDSARNCKMCATLTHVRTFHALSEQRERGWNAI